MSMHTSSLTLAGGAAFCAFTPYTVVAGAYVRGTQAFLSTDLIIKTPFVYGDDGSLKIDFDQIQHDPLIIAFLKTYGFRTASAGAGSTAEIVSNERNEQYQAIISSTGGAGDTQLLMCESYGAVQGANRLLTVSLGHILASSGSFTQEAGKFTHKKLSWQSVAADYACTVTGAASGLMTTAGYGVDAAATITIAATNHYEEKFVVKA